MPLNSIVSRLCFFLVTFFGLQPMVFALETETREDKTKYSLFNPTPTNLMREIQTDRPDKTESPYPVDAGHFQFETDVLVLNIDKRITQDSITNVKTTAEKNQIGVNIINLKWGLTNTTDIQLVFANYVQLNQSSNGVADNKSGIGDTTLRYKINLFGADSGPIALGIMPYIKLPTNINGLANKQVEGGLIIPAALALPNDFSLGFMAQLDFKKNAANEGLHPEFISTYSIGHDLWGDLAMYTEIFSAASIDAGSEWISTLDIGATYGIATNIQLDAGVNIGITEAADDLNPFIGLSAKF